MYACDLYFIVTNNVLHTRPGEMVVEKYDLKGSSVYRYERYILIMFTSAVQSTLHSSLVSKCIFGLCSWHTYCICAVELCSSSKPLSTCYCYYYNYSNMSPPRNGERVRCKACSAMFTYNSKTHVDRDRERCVGLGYIGSV